MTGRELVTAALRLIGAVAPGESLDAAEATDGLASINRMLDSWSNEGLTIHAVTGESPLTLTAGDASVTLGASGDITTRPMTIEKAVIRNGTTDYAPLRVMTASEYAAISDKSVQSIPDSVYDDGGYPQRTLTLYPVPSSSSYSLVLFAKRQLSQIATLDTDVSFPPGYERALIFNGACELAPEYGKAIPDYVFAAANDSKAVLKRANYKPGYLSIDDVPAYARRGGFDINTGGYR